MFPSSLVEFIATSRFLEVASYVITTNTIAVTITIADAVDDDAIAISN